MSQNIIIDKKTKIKLYNLDNNLYNKYSSYIFNIVSSNIIYFCVKNFKTNNFFSIFMEECELSKLFDADDEIEKTYQYYYMFSIFDDDCGINHVGIVNYISNIFMKNKISIIYINTFNQNIILVSEKDFDNATVCFYSYFDNDKIKFLF
jgi:hypothetical protein